MIPEAAVEAAADAFVRMRRDGIERSSFEYARAALEAAAPVMLAMAWDEGNFQGYRQGADDELSEPEAANPYRTAK